MLIRSVNQSNSEPNFGALKSIKCKGLYKQYPEITKKLVDSLNESVSVKRLYEQFDGDIVLSTQKVHCGINSYVRMFFVDPTAKGLKRLFKTKCVECQGISLWTWAEQGLNDATKSLLEKNNHWTPKIEQVFEGITSANKKNKSYKELGKSIEKTMLDINQN